MYKCLEKICRFSSSRSILKVQRQTCCAGNSISLDRKSSIHVFHPRLHDGYICNLPRIVLKSHFTTFTQTQAVEEELDDLYRQITIEVKGHDKEVLNSYTKFLVAAATELEINHNVPQKQPETHFHRRTLNKAVFASKRAKVQYEIRTHFKVFEVQKLTGSTASVFIEYIQRNLPEGCAMKLTKYKLHQLPENLTETIKDRLQNVASESKPNIEAGTQEADVSENIGQTTESISVDSNVEKKVEENVTT
ncbi:28S ribosomal protein S10, mitochondrial-like [Mytilus californianus]|uniref:28S ribosomal protein S10, mitochondrial-like n=1 Tax=Mytilus californianus TaxID=6549 RepID=UPI002247AC2F|nr:28S ribosomal protein S10, mitochondrial-like [Mytilus californianus]